MQKNQTILMEQALNDYKKTLINHPKSNPTMVLLTKTYTQYLQELKKINPQIKNSQKQYLFEICKKYLFIQNGRYKYSYEVFFNELNHVLSQLAHKYQNQPINKYRFPFDIQRTNHNPKVNKQMLKNTLLAIFKSDTFCETDELIQSIHYRITNLNAKKQTKFKKLIQQLKKYQDVYYEEKYHQIIINTDWSKANIQKIPNHIPYLTIQNIQQYLNADLTIHN